MYQKIKDKGKEEAGNLASVCFATETKDSDGRTTICKGWGLI